MGVKIQDKESSGDLIGVSRSFSQAAVVKCWDRGTRMFGRSRNFYYLNFPQAVWREERFVGLLA